METCLRWVLRGIEKAWGRGTETASGHTWWSFSPQERQGLNPVVSKHFFNICSLIPSMLRLFSGFQTSFKTGPLFK